MKIDQIVEIKAVMYDLLAEEIMASFSASDRTEECDMSDAIPMIHHNKRMLEALREDE